MNYFKRCILNIIRKPSKTLLLFLIIFLLGNLVCGSYAIAQSTTLIQNDIKQKLGALVTIHMDSKMMEEYATHIVSDNDEIYRPFLDIVDVFNEITQDERVQYSDYMYYYGQFYSREIKGSEIGVYDEETIDPLTNILIQGVNQPYFSDIKDQRISITEGRTFTDEEIESGAHVIILDESFKSVNDTCESVSYEYIEEEDRYCYVCHREERDLKVGDKITLVRQIYSKDDSNYSNSGYMTVKDVYYEDEVEYEIIGFYKEITEIRDNCFSPSYMDLNGESVTVYSSVMKGDAYIPGETLLSDINDYQKYVNQYRSEVDNLIKANNNFNLTSLSIELNDPEELDDFMDMIEKEYKSNGFINMKYFSTKNTFDLVAGPITSLTTVSLIVLIVSIIVSIVILTLVIILFLKDRRHEMGIYISLGERKWKILMQIILEVCLVAMISVSFSLVTGFKLGDTIANQVIASSTEKQEEVLESQLAEIGSVNPENLQPEEITSQMSFTMDISYIVSVYCISFVVVLLSSIIPVMYVLRIEPKKILM